MAETVGDWLRRDIARRAKIPGSDDWKKTAFAKGRFRMLIDGVPYYFADHVRHWKAGNRAALCRGTDPNGVTQAALIPKAAKK